MKIFDFFCLKIFNFSVINFSVYLNRRVFVMRWNSAHDCMVLHYHSSIVLV